MICLQWDVFIYSFVYDCIEVRVLTLPKFNVRFTWFGYWTPSNMVSDCHHVWLCGSCKSVKYSGSWSPYLENIQEPSIQYLQHGQRYIQTYLHTSQLFRFEYPVWTQKSWSSLTPHVFVDSINTPKAAFSNSGMHRYVEFGLKEQSVSMNEWMSEQKKLFQNNNVIMLIVHLLPAYMII